MTKQYRISGNERDGFNVNVYELPKPGDSGLIGLFGAIKYATHPGGQIRRFSTKEAAQAYIVKRERIDAINAKKSVAA